MFRKSVGLMLSAMGIDLNQLTPLSQTQQMVKTKAVKGQKRAARGKPSGAVKFKREAVKRRNIRVRKGK